MKNLKEADFQKAILQFLKLKGFYVWRNQSTGIFNPKGKGFIPLGQTGVSDILGILPDGRFLAIEVKKPKGKATPNQIEFLDNINKHKGLGFIAVTVEDVQKILSDGGYL